MTDLYYEMQALTWRAKPPIQQDAILIGNKVIQHDGLISKCYLYQKDDDWCALFQMVSAVVRKRNRHQNAF